MIFYSTCYIFDFQPPETEYNYNFFYIQFKKNIDNDSTKLNKAVIYFVKYVVFFFFSSSNVRIQQRIYRNIGFVPI